MHKHNLTWLWLSVVVIIFDQAVKFVIKHHFDFNTIHRVTSFFNIVYVRNYGAAFGFLDEPGGKQDLIFSFISIGVSILLTIWLLTLEVHHRWRAAALGLVIGGALSNFWGRFTLGYVVDFLDFHLANYHWPAFNIADAAICIGAIMLLISFVKKKK